MRKTLGWFINESWSYLVGIIYWPTTVALLFKMYMNLGLDFKQQQAIETIKIQNSHSGCKARLHGELVGAIVLVVLGYLIAWNFMLTIGSLFFLISVTEVLLRQAAKKF